MTCLMALMQNEKAQFPPGYSISNIEISISKMISGDESSESTIRKTAPIYWNWPHNILL